MDHDYQDIEKLYQKFLKHKAIYTRLITYPPGPRFTFQIFNLGAESGYHMSQILLQAQLIYLQHYRIPEFYWNQFIQPFDEDLLRRFKEALENEERMARVS